MTRPPETETTFQTWVIGYAHAHRWYVAHFRPARVQRYGREIYETPVSADGKGWPDLVLVRERVVYAELKGIGRKLRPEQEDWRDRLLEAGQEWYVWDPRDRAAIEKILA